MWSAEDWLPEPEAASAPCAGVESALVWLPAAHLEPNWPLRSPDSTPTPIPLVLLACLSPPACPCAGNPGEVEEAVSFTGGSVTDPSIMRRSESDITAAAIGCSDEATVVTGAICESSGPRTTKGAVVLGRIAWACAVRSVAEIPRSARFTSSLGGSSEGWTTAVGGFSGRGATIVRAGVISADHIMMVGTGIS